MPTLLAASVTPFGDSGDRLDEAAVAPLVELLEAGGADGVFALGTTGEGVLLTPAERRQAARRFREACRGTLVVHCGAQSTADTAALAADAAELGADAAAAIPPPYYPLDDDALAGHFVAAARACAPLPFYLYAFTARSGYPLPPAVIERVAERVDNVAGLKVSEAPFDRVQPYLTLGLPVFVGNEPLISQALAAGAAGAVSGLAAGFPERVADVVHDPTPAGAAALGELRGALGAATLIAALKHVLSRRGVPLEPAVRAPLRPLTAGERDAVDRLLESGAAAQPAGA